MENTEIYSHTELVMRIMHLQQEKFRQEEELEYSIREIGYSLNPVTLTKKYLHELAENSGVQIDLAKIGLNLGANLLIDRILGKNNSFKGLLSALIVEKFSASFINNNLSKIISRISSLMHRHSDHEPFQQ